MLRNRLAFLPLAAVISAGAVNFLWGLGKSSLFVDEGISWSIAREPLGRPLLDAVAKIEITPPTYYAGLHEVIGHTSDSETAMRLPSVIAGIALVAAVYWVAVRLAGRTAALCAASLCALSPLVLEYSQQARVYVFAMLLCTLAAGAALELQRTSPRSRARHRWLAAFICLAVAAIWSHYTAALVVAPLLYFAARRVALERRDRILLFTFVGGASLLLLFVLAHQLGEGNQGGVAGIAHLTLSNFVEVLGAPFQPRSANFDLTVATGVGAVAIVVAGLIAMRDRTNRTEAGLGTFALPLAGIPVAVLTLITAFGPDVLVTRYAAVAVPFMLILLGGAVARTTTLKGIGIALTALAAAGVGLATSHAHAGYYTDVRGATRAIASDAKPGDGIVVTGGLVYDYFVHYHAERAGLRGIPIINERAPQTLPLLATRKRVWLLASPPSRTSVLDANLKRSGFQPVSNSLFTGVTDLELTLARRIRIAPASRR